MRTIKFTAGMSPEFEIIRTDAPDNIIEEQLILNCKREEDTIEVVPYDVLENKGYTVDLIGCQDDDELWKMQVDKEFDWYDYYR